MYESRCDAALAAVDRGWHVFAVHGIEDGRCTCGDVECEHPGKHPFKRTRGFYDATDDPGTAGQIWRRRPYANVAVATGASKLVVVDVDGPAGDESLQQLEDDLGPLPDTYEVATGRADGGTHLYFAGEPVPSKIGFLPGVDIKSAGSYVVAAGSVHATGHTYAAVNGAAVAALPDAWRERLTETRRHDGPGLSDPGEPIGEGSRHKELVTYAARLRAIGMDGAAIAAALHATNAARCKPPLPDDEVDSIADWAQDRESDPEPHRIGVTEPAASDPFDGVVRMSDVSPRKVDWLWPGRIPLGKLVVLDGDPGLGKSTVLCDLAARVSTGAEMPDGVPGVGPAGVVMLSGEDDSDDTSAPRLIAAGADMTRVVAVQTVLDTDESGRRVKRPVVLPDDLDFIVKVIEREAALLVCIDPLMSFLSGQVNAHRDQDVRRALYAMARAAAKTGATMILLRHLNKDSGTNVLYRGGGSIGIVGAARAGLVAALDPDDTTETRRVLASQKNNLAKPAPALAYRLDTDLEYDCSRVEWLGVSRHRASDLLVQPESTEDRVRREEAKAFLEDYLESGPVLAHEAKRDAAKLGIGDRTLDRARIELGIRTRKSGFGESPWLWEWPAPDDSPSEGPYTPQAGENGDCGENGGPGESNDSFLAKDDVLATLGGLGEDPDEFFPEYETGTI